MADLPVRSKGLIRLSDKFTVSLEEDGLLAPYILFYTRTLKNLQSVMCQKQDSTWWTNREVWPSSIIGSLHIYACENKTTRVKPSP